MKRTPAHGQAAGERHPPVCGPAARRAHRSASHSGESASMTMTPIPVIGVEPAQPPRARLAMRRFVMLMRGDPQRGTDDHHHRWPQQIGQCRLAHRILHPDDVHPIHHSRQCAPMFRSMKHLRFPACRTSRSHRLDATPPACVRKTTFAHRSVTPDVFQPFIIASPPSLGPPDCHALPLQHRPRRRPHADGVVLQSCARTHLTRLISFSSGNFSRPRTCIAQTFR